MESENRDWSFPNFNSFSAFKTKRIVHLPSFPSTHPIGTHISSRSPVCSGRAPRPDCSKAVKRLFKKGGPACERLRPNDLRLEAIATSSKKLGWQAIALRILRCICLPGCSPPKRSCHATPRYLASFLLRSTDVERDARCLRMGGTCLGAEKGAE